jgi:hypothetical protein
MSIDEIMMNRIWKQRDDLLKENKRLEDHIRRLEEAGDEAIYKTNLFDREAHWNKAKEVKP